METGFTWDLWSDLQQLLGVHFMVNALEAGTVVAVVAGLAGYFVVLRGQTFASHALSQVGFPGAAGAVVVGAPPIAGLLVFCVAAAAGIGLLSGRAEGERTSETAGIGAILAFALALGFLFATLYKGFIDSVVTDALFGTIIGVSDGQVTTLVVGGAAVLVVLAVIGRPLLFASVEPDVAAARGVPVRALSFAFLIVLGVAIAEAALIVGALLVFTLVVTPAAAAQQLTSRPPLAMALSMAIALLVTWLGMFVAFFSPYPIGFFVTSIAFAVYLLARGFRALAARLGTRDLPAPAAAAA